MLRLERPVACPAPPHDQTRTVGCTGPHPVPGRLDSSTPSTDGTGATPMKHLRQLREKCGWSQLDLALRLGVSQAAVSKWESGQVAPSETNRYRLLVLFATAPPRDTPGAPAGPRPEEHSGGGEMAGVG